jgi:7,8-dihydropterin-6-yl-methyl-4-(beta-D-ribofuranosyl)aminobenzene 5'-phosphate synthase
MVESSIRVTALVADTPAHGAVAGVREEHGLSLLIEAHGKRVLFDTGSGSAVCENANVLGMRDVLTNLDGVVLSHGHYDHTGGLTHVLRLSSGRLPVFARPLLFRPKVRHRNGETVDIGVPVTKSEIDGMGGRVYEEVGIVQIFRNYTLSGLICPDEGAAWVDDQLCVRCPDDQLVPDQFPEEQALSVCDSEGGLVVFIGCAHRGLVNSIEAVKCATGARRIRAVFGGAHLNSASPERIRETALAVADLEPELVVLGHCTGVKAEDEFAGVLGERFMPLRAGETWSLRLQ